MIPIRELLVIKLEIEEIISKKIIFEPEKGCWFIREDWSEYAKIKKELAHRFIYRKYIGSLSSDLFVCHICDRPGCINPNHLFQGTNKDNMNDAIYKKRRYQTIPSETKKKILELKKQRERARWNKLVRFCGE